MSFYIFPCETIANPILLARYILSILTLSSLPRADGIAMADRLDGLGSQYPGIERSDIPEIVLMPIGYY